MPLDDLVLGQPLPGFGARRAIGASATSRLVRLLGAGLLVVACSRDHDAGLTGPSITELAARTSASPVLPALIEEPVQLTSPTYENSGESVHPDVVEFPYWWNGWRYWLTMTPYP